MGLFSRLFGATPDHPPLPPDSAATGQIDGLRAALEPFVRGVADHLEVVPADDEAFVFLGHPPKRFGIAWLHDGKVHGLKELVESNHLSPGATAGLIERLGAAYAQASAVPRYAVELGGKSVVVIPSGTLERDVHDLIEGATRH